MITFEGKMSRKNKFFTLGLYKARLIIICILFCLGSPLIVLPTCIAFSKLGLIFFIFVPIGIFMILFLIMLSVCPDKVVIDDNSITLYNKAMGKNYEPEKLIFDDIISIEDHGDFYLFIAEMKQYFICQKNLLKMGTLEDFEKLFADKIEIKTED